MDWPTFFEILGLAGCLAIAGGIVWTLQHEPTLYLWKNLLRTAAAALLSVSLLTLGFAQRLYNLNRPLTHLTTVIESTDQDHGKFYSRANHGHISIRIASGSSVSLYVDSWSQFYRTGQPIIVTYQRADRLAVQVVAINSSGSVLELRDYESTFWRQTNLWMWAAPILLLTLLPKGEPRLSTRFT